MQAMKVGLIGLDTSHCEAFVNVMNAADGQYHVPGARVVGAYPGGSALCALSRDRLAKFTETLRDKHGIPMFESIEELGRHVDAFVLHSVDGRQHLEQFRILSRFGKPVFIDKPLACSAEDARQIAALALETRTPWMSASSIRYAAGIRGLTTPEDMVGSCEAFGTMPILDDYPTYFWYGVHGVDALFSYMGTGCRVVQTLHSDQTDLLIGTWEDGRIGTVRGMRFTAYHFGCSVFTKKGTVHGLAQDQPPAHFLLVQEVVKFFQTGASPIAPEETLEVMAFLEAAGQSLSTGGRAVKLPR
jgi:predicted dehydrogenase